jgi:hypothetical protein
MWIPQCAQCFLHFWRYNNIPWKPVCHWDFDILMWLLPSWCDFLPTRCYMGLMWLLPNWCDLNPSLVYTNMYFQKVWGNCFGIQLQSHLFRNRWIDSRNRKWFGRRTPFILEEDGLLSSTSNQYSIYSQLISGCTSHHMKYSHNVDEIPIAWLYDHIVSCIPIIFPNLIVGCLYPHRITITIIATYAIYISWISKNRWIVGDRFLPSGKLT